MALIGAQSLGADTHVNLKQVLKVEIYFRSLWCISRER